MNYWSAIENKLKDHIETAIQLLLIILSVYIFFTAEDHRIWKVPILFLGLISWFFFHKKTKHPIIWILLFLLLIFDLSHSYFWLANHHFMLMFLVLIVISYSYHRQSEVLLKNVQLLLAFVILASVIQKITSSQFMSGNFNYYMINRGTLFGNFLNFFPENHEIAKRNVESFIALNATDPNLHQSIIIKNVNPNVRLISIILVWGTIILESIVAFAILWKPKSTWTHVFFTTMIVGILITRLETGFMALLAICGIFLCRNLKLRLFNVLVVLGCAALIITKYGYH
ncbi:hypothetical protein H8K90_15580 [Winogradskyella echinorum]|uniref:O-Antigen ligase n=1 Tax=Winogradskyella echinorum TaxID=538189 RepID=A0ABR6Y6D5_9FLAO|nr:hypothetical protein [Winogradskyella echinorum]MBC3847818.1 hypothetical protein [Winogradskyella echinorum]MBC5752166.1 hypothetical protein [Winogradskyella echinorum]